MTGVIPDMENHLYTPAHSWSEAQQDGKQLGRLSGTSEAPPSAPTSAGCSSQYGRLLKPREAAEKLGHSVSWLYGQLQIGSIPAGIYIGRNLFFPEVWLDRWIGDQVLAGRSMPAGCADELAAGQQPQVR